MLRTRAKIPVALLLGTLVLPGARAYAWGADGHRIVGEIARRNLTAGAAEIVSALLAGDDENYRTLAQATLWADHVKSDDDRTWHYVNLPRNSKRNHLTEACKRPEWCVTEAVTHFHRRLTGDGDMPSRREALKYLAHFVGDVHQPLHAGRRADAGGNTIRVSFFGREYRVRDLPYNLHAIWDTSIIRRQIERDHGDWRRYADALAAGITPRQRSKWIGTTPEDWTLESSRLAFSEAYPVPKNIEDRYYENSVSVIERQLQRAGIRLAELLNRALD